MASAAVVRSTALRAGGACVRCRRGKTKCVYENGRAPCKNCAKGMHECFLPSESHNHLHSATPVRRPRESLPGERAAPSSSDRQPVPAAPARNHVQSTTEKLTPELIAECERVISKTLPACVAFHKPGLINQLKNGTLEPNLIHALLAQASRSSPALIRRYGGQGGAGAAAEHFAIKTMNIVNSNLDGPNLSDIQSLCLMVLHEWGGKNAIRAYCYLGLAARMAQMYRIVSAYRQQSDPEQFLQDESFRRTLWLIYILDCFLTACPGRAPALTQYDIKNVPLPCLDINYHFGSPAIVRTIHGSPPPGVSVSELGDVGEYGHIVLATKVWRDVIEMLTTTNQQSFSEDLCNELDMDIERVRQGLPPHFADKPGQINLHITMGSGYTYAMIHCLLHCASIFLNRRRILHLVTTTDFNAEAWRLSGHPHQHTADRILSASHNIIGLLAALEGNPDKEVLPCFPIFMSFSAFTASSTVAYLSLKGLTSPSSSETASYIVREGLRFLVDGSESWLLVAPWHRHLAVMSKVLNNGETPAAGPTALAAHHHRVALSHAPDSVKDETGSQQDNSEAMEFDTTSLPPSSGVPAGEVGTRGSEPPPSSATGASGSTMTVPRRTGVTTINGGSGGVSTPASVSPPPAMAAHLDVKGETPEPSSLGGQAMGGANGGGSVAGGDGPGSDAGIPNAGPNGTGGHEPADMTPAELCAAFEAQLLALDDLAAFMGGGV